jgi:hypothetical protein
VDLPVSRGQHVDRHGHRRLPLMMRLPRSLALLTATVAILVAVPSPVAAADSTAPVPDLPALSFRHASITGSGIPLRARWHATDPSGIASYQAQVRIDGGSWATRALVTPASSAVSFSVPSPHEAQVRVRATDGAGNTGPWVTGPAFRVRRYSEASSAARLSGQWSAVRSSAFFGGKAYRSTTKGAGIDIAYTGHMVAMVGRKGPSGGSITLSENAAAALGESLKATTTRSRLVIEGTGWHDQASRTVRIRVTTPNAWFDGFVVIDEPAADPVLVGAGDIATCGYPGASRTARLLDGIAGRVFAAGDLAYPTGTRAQLENCYGPTWGRWRRRTSPVPGNHEYYSTGAAPYYAYFGSRAGTAGKGWYAYDLGTWRIYNLNANCTRVACGAGSEQVKWLAADLEANPRACVAAVWHQPLFSSGIHGNTPDVRTLWKTLENAGADLVLNGHDHDYERFAPQRSDGTADAAGMVEFVVGTGGGGLRAMGTVKPNSMVRQTGVFGVLKLTLHPGSYDFAFVPEAGKTFRDAGSATCH